MIRIVPDTNLIASATIVEAGNPNKILRAWQQDKIEIVISPQILEELRRVLFYERIRKRSWMTDDEVRELLSSIERGAISTPGQLQLEPISSDPEDDKFIIAALEGNADYIVSGDPHLKDVGSYKGIKIVSPADFMRVLRRKGRGR